MTKKALLATGLLGLCFTGCVIQQPKEQPQQAPQPQYYPQPQGGVYYYEYRNWSGPGWYYGIYFRDERRYRNWYNQRRGRRYYRNGKRAYPVRPDGRGGRGRGRGRR